MAEFDRVQQLHFVFEAIERERMVGLPILNQRLRVATLGFVRVPAENLDQQDCLQGILVTPWLMSLVQLTISIEPMTGLVGQTATHRFGSRQFAFMTGFDDRLGRYDTCALFSPMYEFVDQAHAEQVALEVLRTLRSEDDELRPLSTSVLVGNPLPSRRRFLLGRHAA